MIKFCFVVVVWFWRMMEDKIVLIIWLYGKKYFFIVLLYVILLSIMWDKVNDILLELWGFEYCCKLNEREISIILKNDFNFWGVLINKMVIKCVCIY